MRGGTGGNVWRWSSVSFQNKDSVRNISTFTYYKRDNCVLWVTESRDSNLLNSEVLKKKKLAACSCIFSPSPRGPAVPLLHPGSSQSRPEQPQALPYLDPLAFAIICYFAMSFPSSSAKS